MTQNRIKRKCFEARFDDCQWRIRRTVLHCHNPFDSNDINCQQNTCSLSLVCTSESCGYKLLTFVIFNGDRDVREVMCCQPAPCKKITDKIISFWYNIILTYCWHRRRLQEGSNLVFAVDDCTKDVSRCISHYGHTDDTGTY